MKARSNIFHLTLGIVTLSALLTGCGINVQNGGISSSETAQEMEEEDQDTTGSIQENDTDISGEATGQTASGESIVTNGGEVISLSALEHQDSAAT